ALHPALLLLTSGFEGKKVHWGRMGFCFRFGWALYEERAGRYGDGGRSVAKCAAAVVRGPTGRTRPAEGSAGGGGTAVLGALPARPGRGGQDGAAHDDDRGRRRLRG